MKSYFNMNMASFLHKYGMRQGHYICEWFVRISAQFSRDLHFEPTSNTHIHLPLKYDLKLKGDTNLLICFNTHFYKLLFFHFIKIF